MPSPTDPDRPLVVGVTGGIGSGKSTVCAEFAAHGVETFDADDAVREVQAPGTAAFEAIVTAFGPSILDADGDLDRAALRAAVFEDDDARARLEAIVHPAVRRVLADRVDASRGPYCLLAIPLLVEKGAYDFVDRVLVVDCEESLQIARVRARSGLSEPQIRAIIDAQATRAARLARADDVIDNSSGREALKAAVARLHERYLRLAASRDGDDESGP